MKAFILAAGLGTRLRPLTDEMPKALVPVNGVPLLERNIAYLVAQGVTEFVVNVHHFADRVEDFLQRNGCFGHRITISDERNMLLDTGGGLLHASRFLNDGAPFLMYNVDILTSLNIRKMYEQHTQSGALATLAVSQRASSRYLLFDEGNRLCGWRNVKTGEEKPARPAPAGGLPVPNSAALTPLAFGGIHMISPEIFSHLNGFGEKFSIVDAYLALAAERRIEAYDMQGERWMDVGKPEALEIANRQ